MYVNTTHARVPVDGFFRGWVLFHSIVRFLYNRDWRLRIHGNLNRTVTYITRVHIHAAFRNEIAILLGVRPLSQEILSLGNIAA